MTGNGLVIARQFIHSVCNLRCLMHSHKGLCVFLTQHSGSGFTYCDQELCVWHIKTGYIFFCHIIFQNRPISAGTMFSQQCLLPTPCRQILYRYMDALQTSRWANLHETVVMKVLVLGAIDSRRFLFSLCVCAVTALPCWFGTFISLNISITLCCHSLLW